MSRLIPAILLVLLVGSLPVFVAIGVRALLKYSEAMRNETVDR